MAQLLDYRINVPNPAQDFLSGLKTGTEIQQILAGREAAAMEQERLRAVERERAAFFANPYPTMRDAAKLASILPKEQADALRPYIEKMSEEEQRSTLNFGMQVLGALESNPKVGIDLLRNRAQAERNSGRVAQADMYDQFANSAETSGPESVFKIISPMVAALPGAKEAMETAAKAREISREEMKAPFELTKSKAEAEKAAVAAKFAESNAVKDLEKKGWDIEKIKSDTEIAKQNASIAAIEQQIKKEELDFKKNELKLKLLEKQEARDATIREKTANVNQGTFAMDNMLNTVDKVLANPELNDVLGPFEGTLEPDDFTAGIRLSDKEADAIALINQLKSQAFVANVPLMKGLGTLTDAEGARLENLLGSLSRTQSDEGFRESLKEIQRLLLKSRKMLAEKYGVPQPPMDTPAASARGTAGKSIDEILQELGITGQ